MKGGADKSRGLGSPVLQGLKDKSLVGYLIPKYSLLQRRISLRETRGKNTSKLRVARISK